MKKENKVENGEISLTQRMEAWFNSPEGQASIDAWKEEREKEERTKQRFSSRVLRMDRPEIDHWMNAIIGYYSSDRYKDKWYKRGIFPPCTLYDMIYEFIVEHGYQVGETEEGNPVYQYMSWKVDAIYGQGECHYNFVRTDEVAHRYGEGIFYVIQHNGSFPNRITLLNNILSKSWDGAKYIIDEFCQMCKMKDIFVCPADFSIIEVTVDKPENVVNELKKIFYSK